jgi:hypothetical protein
VSFITPEGMFESEREPDVPESHPYAFQHENQVERSGLPFHPDYKDPWVNLDMAQHQFDDAYHKQPQSLWEAIKFTGQRLIASQQDAIPMAEWPFFGRGRNIDWWQSPQVVSLQAGQHGWLDRYGPYRHKVLNQHSLDDYLAGHVPAEVFALENATAR